MTNDEMTVLMIAAEGESMIPIGRWEKPIHDLAQLGLMSKLDSTNYVITPAGREAVKAEEQQRDGDFANALRARRRKDDVMRVDMVVLSRNIKFDLTYDPDFVSDSSTRAFLQYNGACEPEVVHLMRRVIRPGDFVIDGGANIGFLTMVMSRLVGDQGHVEAFEPSTLNFKKLRANLELNAVENVTVINRALWSDDAPVELHQSIDSSASSLMPFEGVLNHIPVNGLTLDKWCLAYEQAPRLLKLDIEGAELQALQGADKMLTRGIDFVVCEMNLVALERFGTTQTDLRDYMAGKGYSTFTLHENGERPTPIARAQAVLPDRANLNVLFSIVGKVHEAWGAELS
jgi:FkbM family methyltransferase